jgi:hypothetical protein
LIVVDIVRCVDIFALTFCVIKRKEKEEWFNKVGLFDETLFSKADSCPAKRLEPKKGTNWNSQQQDFAFFFKTSADLL